MLKPIVSTVKIQDDFDISASSSIIKNCKIFMADKNLRKQWNDCSVILKECRNELNHAVKQNASPRKYQNFIEFKGNFHLCFQQLSDALDHDSEGKRLQKSQANH